MNIVTSKEHIWMFQGDIVFDYFISITPQSHSRVWKKQFSCKLPQIVL